MQAGGITQRVCFRRTTSVSTLRFRRSSQLLTVIYLRIFNHMNSVENLIELIEEYHYTITNISEDKTMIAAIVPGTLQWCQK